MASSFKCKLVTPEASLLDSEASYASVPAWDGLFGILPGRAPILARLGIGELQIRSIDEQGKTSERSFFVGGGFVKMAGGELTVLAEAAVPAENISETDAQAELKEAEARTVPDDATDRIAERQRIADAIKGAKTKLGLAQRVKAKGI